MTKQQAAELVQTSVMQARSGSVSLKTTIPEIYVSMLALKKGDKLDWTHEIVNNEVVIRIKKARK